MTNFPHQFDKTVFDVMMPFSVRFMRKSVKEKVEMD